MAVSKTNCVVHPLNWSISAINRITIHVYRCEGLYGITMLRTKRILAGLDKQLHVHVLMLSLVPRPLPRFYLADVVKNWGLGMRLTEVTLPVQLDWGDPRIQLTTTFDHPLLGLW